jgi:hypothetical protein
LFCRANAGVGWRKCIRTLSEDEIVAFLSTADARGVSLSLTGVNVAAGESLPRPVRTGIGPESDRDPIRVRPLSDPGPIGIRSLSDAFAAKEVGAICARQSLKLSSAARFDA